MGSKRIINKRFTSYRVVMNTFKELKVGTKPINIYRALCNINNKIIKLGVTYRIGS